VLATSVPKTTIYKNNQLVPAKGKVGLPEDGKMSSPAGDFILPQKSSKGNFGSLITTSANTGHDLRTLCFGENVRHRRTGGVFLERPPQNFKN
jgi:hypothetical protein